METHFNGKGTDGRPKRKQGSKEPPETRAVAKQPNQPDEPLVKEDQAHEVDPVALKAWLEKQAAMSGEHSGQNDPAAQSGQKGE